MQSRKLRTWRIIKNYDACNSIPISIILTLVRYLQQNLISKIENLEMLDNLDTLTLSENMLTDLNNASKIPKLHSLQVNQNHLHNLEDIQDLRDCANLSILDLANNNLDNPEIISILEAMPNLGNEKIIFFSFFQEC
jgi:Leucine-rich repeat (LRR) protein